MLLQLVADPESLTIGKHAGDVTVQQVARCVMPAEADGYPDDLFVPAGQSDIVAGVGKRPGQLRGQGFGAVFSRPDARQYGDGRAGVPLRTDEFDRDRGVAGGYACPRTGRVGLRHALTLRRKGPPRRRSIERDRPAWLVQSDEAARRQFSAGATPAC